MHRYIAHIAHFDSQGRFDLIIAGFVNFCWVFFKWGLLAAVVGVVVAVPMLYERVDEEIRRRVESDIAQRFPELRVTLRWAELLEGEGIVLRDLTISEPGAVGPGAEMLHVEEVFLACQTDAGELVSGAPQIDRVRIRRPTVRATRRADGLWNLAKLACGAVDDDLSLPDVTIEAGTIEILDQFGGATETLSLENVHLSLTAPKDLEAPPSPICQRRVEGSLGGDHVRRVEFEGLVDLAGSSWSLTGMVDGLDLSPELSATLPLANQRAVADGLDSLRGRLDFNYRLAGSWSGEGPCEFNIWGGLTHGRIDDPRLPRPLGDVRAKFQAKNDGFSVWDLHASSGRMKLERASFAAGGYGANAPMRLKGAIRDLELDRSLRNVLPPSAQEHWKKFDPAGHVDATVELTRQAGLWTPDEITVDCKDASFEFYTLPYRVDQVSGRITLKNDEITVPNLRAFSGGQLIELSGQVFQPLDAPYGELVVNAAAIELDEKLFRALKGKPEAKVVRALHPRGSIGVYYHVWNESHGQPPRKFLRITPNGCAIRYEKCPYEIKNIHGVLEMTDRSWEFRDLVGGNDTAEIRVTKGHFHPNPTGSKIGGELLLEFTATDVPLEAELRDAIGTTHPNLRRLWDDLRLRGTVDLEQLRVRYITGRKGLDVYFRAVPQPGATSIELVYCPYRLGDLRGTLEYVDGKVTVRDFRATHGDVTVAATANCRFDTDGSWRLGLTDLAVEQLRFGREFTQALPERLARVAATLNPRGPFHVGGTVDVGRSGSTASGIWSRWNVDITALQAAIDFGVSLENISGTMKAVGGYDDGRFYSQCGLDLDSLTLLDTQLTQVTGPVWVDNDRVLLGEQVRVVEAFARNSNPDFAVRPIQAEAFGGSGAANGRVVLGDTPGYWINASLTRAELARCVRKLDTGRRNLQGRLAADVELWGTGRSLNSLQGRGRAQLREADIYELPAMVQLLKILSVREPDGTGFSSADIDFAIKGPHIYFPLINFNGDAISLEGTGEMDFNSNINLTFGTRLGTKETIIPAIRELLGGAGDQLVQIHVNGPISDPQVSREPFPGISKTLQQIQSEFPQARTPGRVGPTGAPR